ncbi:MAG: ATP-binding protein [Chitinophagaceae bacterium]
MRVQTLLLVVLWTLYGTGFCFSQESKPNPDHPSGKNAKWPLSNAPAAPLVLEGLFRSLENTRINSQKADIYFRISRYYADRLKIDSALFYSEKIKEESLAGKDEVAMAKHYLAKSSALFYRKKIDMESLNKAIEIFNRNENHLFSGIAYRELARQYVDRQRTNQSINLGDFAQSRKNYHTAISFLTLAGETVEVQRVYYELGRSYYNSYETDSAAFYLITALKLAEKLNDAGRIFNSSGVLGELYIVAGDIPNASKYLKYALDIRTPSTSRIEVRNRLGSYAECLAVLGEFDKAEAAMREYETINVKLGDNWGANNFNKIKGSYHFHRKNYTEALKYLQLAYSNPDEIKGFSFDTKNIANYLARTEYEMGYYDSAIRHMSHVRELATQLRFGADLLDVNLLISQAYEKKGNKDSAFHYFRVYDSIKDSLLTFRKEKTVIELTARYENEKREQQIQLLLSENQLNDYQLRSRMDEIEKQNLVDVRKTQQLALLSQQNEINRLEASEKTLAFENQQKEMVKKQNELTLLEKENELQAAVAAKEVQRKNFAYIAIATILFFSVYVFYRYTQNKKLSRRLSTSLVDLKQAQEQLIKTEKEKEGDKIRVRISRDIHDEVGATLSGVALFSEIARTKIQQHEENDAQVYLDHITANSKEMVEKMSDIVWTINPDNDSFERIIAKLRSYAFNLCAGKGIRLHFDVDDQVCLYSPSMQVRKNIYMLMKEAINNAVKYSGGNNIFLSLFKKEDLITIEIRDDGKGFDKKKKHEGNGLNNMQSRAADLDANFSIDSKEGGGTHIRLQFNFHPGGGQTDIV